MQDIIFFFWTLCVPSILGSVWISGIPWVVGAGSVLIVGFIVRGLAGKFNYEMKKIIVYIFLKLIKLKNLCDVPNPKASYKIIS